MKLSEMLCDFFFLLRYGLHEISESCGHDTFITVKRMGSFCVALSRSPLSICSAGTQ